MNSSHRRALPPSGRRASRSMDALIGVRLLSLPPQTPRARSPAAPDPIPPPPFTSPAGRVRRADGCGRGVVARGPAGTRGRAATAAPRTHPRRGLPDARELRRRSARPSARRVRCRPRGCARGEPPGGSPLPPPPPHRPSTQLCVCLLFHPPHLRSFLFSPERRPGGSLARVHPSPLTLRAHSAYPQRTRDPPRNPSSPLVSALTSRRTDATTTRPSPRRPGRQLCRAAQLCRENINETRRAPPRETIKTPTAPTMPPPAPTTPPSTPPPFTTPPPPPSRLGFTAVFPRRRRVGSKAAAASSA